MNEIYESHAFEYDELVDREDHEGNLPAALHRLFDFRGASVAEFGAGTGRLTRQYVEQVSSAEIFDRSEHMLLKARTNLAQWESKISAAKADNLDIGTPGFGIPAGSRDAILEGWSFGHTVHDAGIKAEETIAALVGGCLSLLRRGGICIFIETLGTFTDSAAPPAPFLEVFYSELENRHGFSREVIRTDYRFDSPEKAARIMGYFFGGEMEGKVRESGLAIIPEFTGIWHAEAL